jgi:hypothetical protein
MPVNAPLLKKQTTEPDTAPSRGKRFYAVRQMV